MQGALCPDKFTKNVLCVISIEKHHGLVLTGLTDLNPLRQCLYA